MTIDFASMTQVPCNRVRRAWLPAALAVVLVPFAGCDKESGNLPLDRKTTALTAETNLKNVTQNLTSSAAFLTESNSVAESLSAFQTCDEVSVGNPAPPACPPDDPTCVAVDPAPIPPDSPSGCDAASMKQDLANLNQDLQDQIDKLIAEVRTEIFIDANIESETETEVVYKLPTSVLCDDATDTECVTEAGKAEPRLRVTSPSQGDLDVAILMTASKFKPFVVKLYRDRIGVALNLGELWKTMAVINPDSTANVTRAAGVVDLALIKNGDRDFSLVAEVTKAIAFVTTEDGQTIDLHLDASDRSYEVRLDGVKKTITASVNIGALRVSAPLENLGAMVGAEPGAAMAPADVFKLVVGGLNGTFTFDGTRDVLAFKGVGLGNQSTTVAVNNNEVFALDINKNADRRFDLTVAMADTASPLMTFTPGFNATMRVKFQSIANRFASVPAWALDDTVAFDLSGSNPSLRSNDAGLQVVSGTLRLTSTALPTANVTVNAGQCLADNPSEAAGGHEILSPFIADLCQ